MALLSLQRGQRVKLSQVTPSKQFMVGVKTSSSSLKFDISCFGLNEAGKLSDDRFFVFYNQPICPGEAIKLLGARGGDSETFGLNLDKLPSSIRRLMFVVSIDGQGEMKQMGASYLRFLVGGQEVARFAFSGQDLGRERALMVAELYFKDEWRVNAVGQGFAGGLDAVLRHFGGEVADSPVPVQPPKQHTATNLAQVKREFQTLCNQTAFSSNTWKSIQQKALATGISRGELFAAIQPIALAFLEDLLEQSAADGVITTEEDAQWTATLSALDLPQDWLIPFHQRWLQEKKLSAIRQGNLPSVKHDLHLSSDEICHFLITAEQVKEIRGVEKRIPVRLAATSKKFYLLEAGGVGKTVPYSNFLKVIPSKGTVTFEMSVRTAAGTYVVENPAFVDAIVTTLVKLHKRQILAQKERGRAIPQEVRIAVWQRDKGQCVQCGAKGRGACLEYDHILPFSKGGASTVNNIRLLCRRCNLEKGDRI
ncbi:hypothetical protein IAD21_00883 [Abditibacteriota bacterium]|nr:hypothetical protein IAD21_00883 [Abditibacteriota bacterium]